MTANDSEAHTRRLAPRAARLARLTVLFAAVVNLHCGGDVPSAAGPVPVRLGFAVQPQAVSAGVVMVPAIRATVQDAQGRAVTSSSASVSIAITGGSGSAGAILGGTLTRTAVEGVATFDDLTIDKAAAAYTLTVQAEDLESATSVAFPVEAGDASVLALTTQPVTVVAGIPLLVEVEVRDGHGNAVIGSTSAISVAILSGTGVPGATLGGTVTRTPVQGKARFDDLTVDRAGSGYRLVATATDVGTVTTNSFTVNPGAPSRIDLTGAPASVPAGYVIAPMQATVLDDQGNVVSGSTAAVSIAITTGSGTAGALLTGTRTRAAVGGVATFTDLSIDRFGVGYTLTATVPGLATATTTGPFDIVAWPVTPTAIHLASDAGDYIGAGRTYRYTRADAAIAATASGGRLSLRIDGDEGWSADFQSPDSLGRLTRGVYNGLTRYADHDPSKGGLYWYGEARACTYLTGWFAVDAAAYDGDVLAAIDLRFEQHCEGSGPALRGTIHWDVNDPTTPEGPVYPIPAGLWEPAADAVPTAGSYVYLLSDAGDYIGSGQTYTYTPATATIGVSSGDGLLSVDVAGWRGRFQAMDTLTTLQPGYYGDVGGYPFHNPTKGGLAWYGQGRGCNELTGWFTVDAVTYQNGELTAIELRFEQHCEGGSPALHGAIRWSK